MIELVIEERRRSIGPFEVGRVLPFAKRRMVGPFIFLDQAKADWKAGRMKLPDGDSEEYIPLPPDPAAPPPAMS
jgi:redox-sensitive bicupin YhaK (pirin superfamily)